MLQKTRLLRPEIMLVNNPNTVLILLAAYKGNTYVREQIDSMLNQDCDNWKLVLSDDGDFTKKILDSYANRFPDKIIRHRSGQRFGSAKAHFMHLIAHFKDAAPYIMLSDQDDVWDVDKVSKTFALMKATEKTYDGPVLVHTDLRIVDAELNEISPSFFAYSKLEKRRYHPHEILIQNLVSGCTLMMNRSLSNLVSCGVNPDKLVMHDHWIALVAAFFGKIAFLDTPTMRYRQHGDNTCGAKPLFSPSYMLAAARRSNFRPLSFQAEAFKAYYGSRLSPDDARILDAVALLHTLNKFARLATYRRFDLWKSPLVRKIGQIFLW